MESIFHWLSRLSSGDLAFVQLFKRDGEKLRRERDLIQILAFKKIHVTVLEMRLISLTLHGIKIFARLRTGRGGSTWTSMSDMDIPTQ